MNRLQGELSHVMRVVRSGKKQGGDLVNSGVGALSGEQDGDEQGIGVAVFQRHRGLGVKSLKCFLNVGDAFGFQHGGVRFMKVVSNCPGHPQPCQGDRR